MPALKFTPRVFERIEFRSKSSTSDMGLFAVTVRGNGAVAKTTFAAADGCTWHVVLFRQFTPPTAIVAPVVFKNVNVGLATLIVKLLYVPVGTATLAAS